MVFVSIVLEKRFSPKCFLVHQEVPEQKHVLNFDKKLFPDFLLIFRLMSGFLKNAPKAFSKTFATFETCESTELDHLQLVQSYISEFGCSS